MLVSVLPALIVIGLLVYAAIDCAQTPAEELRFGRGLWLTVIVLIPVLGPVAWLVWGRTSSPRRHARANTTQERIAPQYPAGPDDDPDFLAELGRAKHRPPTPPENEKPKKKTDKPENEPVDPDA